MQFTKEEYDKYLKSPQWKQKRAKALEKAQDKCEICGFSKWSKKLEVHHITYERFRSERPEDLQVLCEQCHEEQDKERAVRGKAKSEKALHDAQMNGWASKVYGEHWHEKFDSERIS